MAINMQMKSYNIEQHFRTAKDTKGIGTLLDCNDECCCTFVDAHFIEYCYTGTS